MAKRKFFSLDNTPLLIVLSVITALVVCFLADPVQKTTVTIPLEYVNQSSLAEMNLALADTGASANYVTEVTVVAVGRSSSLAELSASGIQATADFRDIDDNGNIQVQTSSDQAGSIMIYSCEPSQVRRNVVSTNRYEERSYNIAAHVQTSILDDFELVKYTLLTESIDTKSIVSTLERTSKDLTDEEINTLINAISRVEANIDVSERIEPYTDSVALSFLDVSGNPIPALDEVCFIEVEVIIGKRLDVHVASSGTPENGYYVESAKASPLTVTVYSITNPAYVIAMDKEIMTEAVSVDSKSSDFTSSVALMLPEEVIVFGNESKTVKAVVKIKPLVTRTFSISSSNITFINQKERMEYQVKDQAVTVTLSGPEDVINAIAAAELKAQIDVSEAVTGISACPIKVSLSFLEAGVTQAQGDTVRVQTSEVAVND